MTLRTPLPSILARLRATRLTIDDHYDDAVDDAATRPLEAGLALLLHDLEATRRRLQVAEDRLRALLYDVLPRGVTEVEGLGTLEPKPGTNRKDWDRARAAQRVVLVALGRLGAVDPDTGEVLDARAVEVASATLEAITTAARLEFRVGKAEAGTGLAAFDLDAADYCREEAGRSTVIARWVDADELGAGRDVDDLADVVRLSDLRDLAG